jgi:hypothetical protein
MSQSAITRKSFGSAMQRELRQGRSRTGRVAHHDFDAQQGHGLQKELCAFRQVSGVVHALLGASAAFAGAITDRLRLAVYLYAPVVGGIAKLVIAFFAQRGERWDARQMRRTYSPCRASDIPSASASQTD